MKLPTLTSDLLHSSLIKLEIKTQETPNILQAWHLVGVVKRRGFLSEPHL